MAFDPSRLPIPQSEVPNLRALARADIEMLGRIEEALRGEKPSLGPGALAESVAKTCGPGLKEVRPIVSVLWRLAFVQRRLDLTTDSFLRVLSASLKEMGTEWTADDARGWSEREDWIRRLLLADAPLGLGAKATELLTEQQVSFCRSRILTDVRPVFDENAQELKGLVPYHTLAVTFHEGSDTREIHIAMDSEDLVALRGHIERAERKERIVRKHLATLDLPVIETGAESNG